MTELLTTNKLSELACLALYLIVSLTLFGLWLDPCFRSNCKAMLTVVDGGGQLVADCPYLAGQSIVVC
ncbi:hypothetical protein L1987_05995 [Smallanthus sonchifolius]|uniref:Uncharacterized protein n=1 Tax=Smallanthus sonchifolius TaxID=185202 RepID=A0ACB9JWY3_9ASTR|nr:hypothetical protein L1987_05995 [Smallanthus sonchifolius]